MKVKCKIFTREESVNEFFTDKEIQVVGMSTAISAHGTHLITILYIDIIEAVDNMLRPL
jgi:hypothetical protein